VVDWVLLGTLVDLLGDSAVGGVRTGHLLHVADGGRKDVGGLGVFGIFALDIQVQHSIRKHELVELKDSFFVTSFLSNEGVYVKHLLLLTLSDVLDLDIAGIDAPLLEVE
jgi:hypothetical protein